MVRLRLSSNYRGNTITLINGQSFNKENWEEYLLANALPILGPNLEVKFQLTDEDDLLNLDDDQWNYLVNSRGLSGKDRVSMVKSLLPAKKSLKAKATTKVKTIKDSLL